MTATDQRDCEIRLQTKVPPPEVSAAATFQNKHTQCSWSRQRESVKINPNVRKSSSVSNKSQNKVKLIHASFLLQHLINLSGTAN